MAAGGGSSGSAAGEGPSKKEVDLVSLRGGPFDVAFKGWLAVLIDRERGREIRHHHPRGGLELIPLISLTLFSSSLFFLHSRDHLGRCAWRCGTDDQLAGDRLDTVSYRVDSGFMNIYGESSGFGG